MRPTCPSGSSRPVATGVSSCHASAWSERASISSSSIDRKSTRLNSSHVKISYAVFCLKKKKKSSGSRDGTGQISESHQDLPPQKRRLDRTFTTRLGCNRHRRTLGTYTLRVENLRGR